MCGTTGEAATLSEAERASIIEFTAVYTRSRMKVIAGIGGNDTLAAANAARRAERLGADALLLTTPYYNKANSEGIVRHFAYVAEHSELPLIVYNVPGRTGVSCTPEHYARLAEIPRINGVKEASGDISLVSRTRHLCGDALNIWSGNDDQTLPMLALGAKGVISVASNIVPQVMATLCATALSGDFFTARAIHEAYAGLFDALFYEVNPIPVKPRCRCSAGIPGGFVCRSARWRRGTPQNCKTVWRACSFSDFLDYESECTHEASIIPATDRRSSFRTVSAGPCRRRGRNQPARIRILRGRLDV